ncbi:MAG: hypothetical protein JHC96_00550 [Brevundimonas sp.]|uniref:hypothetical protein n=1 Tax=Brevundimonas sp. TaxID=1871086 RepID=UPI001A21FBB4|nr:hypothetical protein [Brevundimonas sp.]MBJ7317261.1 hypothetical protein [Brevundimonas sp.]
MSLSAALAAALLLTSAPQAAPQPPQPSTAELEAIIVEGRRIEEAARAYIEEVGEPPRGTRLARWNRPVCISMSNMQPRFAQFVIDRIAANALDAGADVGEPGCKPNVIILATTDGPALAKKLVKEVGLGFRPAINHTNLDRDALSDFQNSDAPVRWWNVVMPVTTDTGDVAITLRGEDPRQVTVRDGSRLRSNIRYDMAWTIVIIDMTKTGGAPFGTLADYVSMVSLAQIDPDADLSGQSTVMNLFRNPVEVDGLSQWDKDYLAALYAAPSDRVNGDRQEAAVAHSLIQQRRERAGLEDAAAGDTPPGDAPQ